MKKMLTVVLAMALMLTALWAFAETTATELNWETVEPMVAEYGLTGDFYTFDEIAVKIWIPSSMTQSELTEEDVANGFIAHFLDDDQTAQVSVVYVDVEGMSLEEYAQVLPEYGVEEVENMFINGIPAISYMNAETDSVTVSFATQAGYILEITMAPVSVEGADIAWGIVTSSIMEL